MIIYQRHQLMKCFLQDTCFKQHSLVQIKHFIDSKNEYLYWDYKGKSIYPQHDLIV